MRKSSFRGWEKVLEGDLDLGMVLVLWIFFFLVNGIYIWFYLQAFSSLICDIRGILPIFLER
jgi:hypothetical protein